MHRNKSVMSHQFSMVPNSNVPRSSFKRPHGYKTTFDAGYLVPVFVDEVYPGDTFNLRMTAFARMATQIFPFMDNAFLDSFFFFVPHRLVWSNFQKFMGEQANPSDSISYVVPQVVSPTGGYAVNSLQDYFGLPTSGQVGGGNTVSHSTLPLRAYNLIWNAWFRDENLQNSVVVDLDDGPDLYSDYVLLRRGKRHDYFTSCLPWPQKGTAVSLPLGTTAPVVSSGIAPNFTGGGLSNQNLQTSGAGVEPDAIFTGTGSSKAAVVFGNSTGLYTDLTSATAATLNQLRLSVSIQQFLEQNARGGTRYTELNRSHFGVISPDARLQRPEYLGGGSTTVNQNPIAQTSVTSTTPLGNLAGMATVTAHNHGFTKSFTEHGTIIGMVCVRADLSYQQGLDRMWSRSTLYDFYFPSFANLGEQAVLNKEIYADGSANDALVFGYQERWSELRHKPSKITGQFRSTYTTPLDAWHLSQKFTSLPTLNSTFIQETPPISRVIAYTAVGSQFLFDAYFDLTCARPLPMYSVPGLLRF